VSLVTGGERLVLRRSVPTAPGGAVATVRDPKPIVHRADWRCSLRVCSGVAWVRDSPALMREYRKGTGIDRLLLAGGAALLAAGIALAIAAPVGATFGGGDGNVEFASTRNAGAKAIFTVAPNVPSGPAGADVGLTAGSADAEPFPSADGQAVYFSSNRTSTGQWAVFSISASHVAAPSDTTDPATELGQTPGAETANDYSPTVSRDGTVVVFNRWWNAPDPTHVNGIYQLQGGTVTPLYLPPAGLEAPDATTGTESRSELNPNNATELTYVDSGYHVHLVTGLGSSPMDTDLSAAASTPAGCRDRNPDWEGVAGSSKIIFDSDRPSAGTCASPGTTPRQLWTMDPHNPGPGATAQWPGLVGSSTQDLQPVFSPSGSYIAYTQPGQGDTVYYYYNCAAPGAACPNSKGVQLSSGSRTLNTEPAWAPVTGGPLVPEAPAALLLPGGALVLGGTVLALRRRRRRAAPIAG